MDPSGRLSGCGSGVARLSGTSAVSDITKFAGSVIDYIVLKHLVHQFWKHGSSALSVPRVVLHPFAGSGSTLVAAAPSGRRCIAVELDQDYCDVIVARREQTLGDEVPSRLCRDDQVLGFLEPQRLGVHGRLEVRERLSASC